MNEKVETWNYKDGKQRKVRWIIEPFHQLTLSLSFLDETDHRRNHLKGSDEDGIAEIQNDDGCRVVQLES